jgi:hypothetical protein
LGGVTPQILSGTVDIDDVDTPKNIVAVPANSYGLIFVQKSGTDLFQMGSFISGATNVHPGQSDMSINDGASNTIVEFVGSGLTIQGQVASSAKKAIYLYRILVWKL